MLAVRANLAAILGRSGEWGRVEEIARDLLETRSRVLGPVAVQTGGAWELLGTSLAHQGRLDGALEAYENSLRIFSEASGEVSENASNAARNVGSILALQGNHTAALAYLDSSIAIDRRLSGAEVNLATKRCRRTFLLFMLGERESAVAQARAWIEVVDSLAGDDDARRSDARGPLAAMLLALGRAEEAETLLRFMVGQREDLPESNPYRASAHCMLGVSLALQGRLEEARRLLEQHYAVIESWGLLTPLHRSLLEDALRATGLSTN